MAEHMRMPPERYEKAQEVLGVTIKKNGCPVEEESITGVVSEIMSEIDNISEVHRIIISLNGEGDIYNRTKRELYQIEDPLGFLTESISEALRQEGYLKA